MSRVAFLLALVSLGCTTGVELLPCPLAPDGGTTPQCAAAAGPAIRFPTAQGKECAGALAARVARYALCSCLPLSLSVSLTTDAIDSRTFASPSAHGAAVGTDGELRMVGSLAVGGSLVAAGADGVHLSRGSSVADNLRSGGPLVALEPTTIGGDAFVSGDVSGPVTVGGTLQLPEDAADGAQAASVTRATPHLDPPCGCDEPPVVSPKQLAQAHATENDDAIIGLSPDALEEVDDAREVELPAGQYYLTTLRTGPDAPLRLHVRGRVALFVGGDVRLGSSLKVQLDPAGELDLVVAGEVQFAGGTLGALDAAARVRLWLGSALLQISDDARIGAVVYGPGTVVSAAAGLSVTGALEVRELAATGAVSIHYDEANLASGATCGLPPEPEVN